jgi:hypothetical protein
MKTWLFMLVQRDAEDRLTGVILQEAEFRPACFSGTPELLKTMEEALPLGRPLVERAAGMGPGCSLGSAAGPSGR